MASEEKDQPHIADAEQRPAMPGTTIVGIGASAGGVGALQKFFEALPAEVGAAFVVIVHLDPETRSELAEILSARSKMPVKQVTKTSDLRPDCVYVIPPDRQLRISDDEISAIPFEEPRGHRSPIDLFFRSLAEQHGDGFAVVLTGAGSDGALGVRAVKEHGGIILVQDPEEAEYPPMPRAAIATEAADFILPVKELARQLVDLVRAKRRSAAAIGATDEDEALRRILAHLRVRTGHDFTNYKRSTVMRRILRRMQVQRADSLEDYFARLRESQEEAQALLADLLISVTTFFRDQRAFEALAKQVIPNLFRDKDASSAIRVWVVGCATGEEAYSIAILLLEEAARHDVRPEIQIFATDMDSRALQIAREGRYPAAIETDIGEDRLRRFFQKDGEHYRVKRELRDLVLFASHSLLKDPPFSHLDLISCRNLLIYLNRELQHQVITTLHYALNPSGYLFLGSSESAEHADHLFRPIDRDSRIFQSSGRSAEKPPLLPRLLGMTHIGERIGERVNLPPTLRGARTMHREALETLSPPSVLVDASYRILHLSENAGRYLQQPGGILSTDLTELVRDEMKHDLRTGLHSAFERGEATLSPAILVRFNGAPHRVYVQVRPVKGRESETEPKRALVIFIEGEADEHAPSLDTISEKARGDAVERLQQELDAAHGRLRTMREESEAANEELRAANEELQSINEEYRSTAEELETSKEELQSINEELQTVNAELKLKLDTVSRANSDLQNLMAATDFGTLFLDPGLRIKRFTPRTADLFNITANDIGRPITDFTHQLNYGDLAGDMRKVLKELVPLEREVQSRTDGWYLVRARPYRTLDDKIDGVVVTFVEVTERRRMEDALRASEERLRREMQLVELSRTPLFVWDFDTGLIRQWNRGSEELYGYTKEEAIGHPKAPLLRTQVRGSSFKDLKSELLEAGAWKGELQQSTKDGRSLAVESQIELITIGGERYVLESTRDVTETKAWESRQHMLLRELTHRVKNTFAVVQGIVHQTWRTGSREEFIERLNGRLAALTNAHELLVESEWKGADLRKMIEDQLAPYAAERISIKGDAVMLPADVATPFGLVLHELATNAVKYGSLSNDKGRVELSWKIAGGGDNKQLKFTWREKDGPVVRKPATRSGFGEQLIRKGLPGAMVTHDFKRSGVLCTIEVPLTLHPGSGNGRQATV